MQSIVELRVVDLEEDEILSSTIFFVFLVLVLKSTVRRGYNPRYVRVCKW